MIPPEAAGFGKDGMPDALNMERIGQAGIRVHELDRAVAFYRDVLGLKFLFRVPNLAFFDCGGVRILLDVVTDPEFDHPSSVFYFSVSDLPKQHERLRANGVEIVTPPHKIATLGDREVWMAFFRDPDRNVHALMSEVPVPAKPGTKSEKKEGS